MKKLSKESAHQTIEEETDATYKKKKNAMLFMELIIGLSIVGLIYFIFSLLF